MQFIVKKALAATLFCFICTNISQAQSSLLPQGHKFEALLNRIDILMPGHIGYTKTVYRKDAMEVIQKADSLSKLGELELSAVDQAYIRSFYLNNQEWYDTDDPDFASKKPIFKTFYKDKANFFEVDQKDFYLAVNPILQYQQNKEFDNDKNVFLNTRGVQLRGLIAEKVGFDATIMENQERGPDYFHRWIADHNATPGVGFYKRFKTTAVDYFDARGSIHFGATKYIKLQFGYDKLFVGNGYRSLFLSDFGNSYLFFKINTRIWKFDYTNLFTELVPQTIHINAGNKILDKKYMAMHRLSLQATRWLNIGVFEAISFGRKNHFEFSYLNPVMFLRAAEQQVGSGDNAMVGLDAKINIAKKVQLYGQLLFNEFKIKELTSGNGWWGNKFGIQAGAKYINAFGVKNLDLQGEVNLVRPFNYSHYDSAANFTHYNQPLAHPSGANFAELIGIARYQPHPKWTMQAIAIYWAQGIDLTPADNVGSNIFKLYNTRSMGDYGYKLPSGPLAKSLYVNAYVGYEVRENIFLETQLSLRNQKMPNDINMNSTLISLGLRMNMFRRLYDY
ncbi:hypothetical protein [Gynurincola endophyticus]|uniref:hypothetical protein n=1 Tax=Gynurincola endophyticus TaxID=2479004 RepID=UPI000F8D80D7|nr:hypothetical protein [Gynurincola endophyticus]